MRVGLVWFRRDLRLHDHEPLDEALASCDAVVPLYVWDPQTWAIDPVSGLRRLGPHRARFWHEAVEELSTRLEAAGSALWSEVGPPEVVVPWLAREVGASTVHLYRATSDEETRAEARVVSALEADGRSARVCDGATLLHPDDLPFPVEQLPDVFTHFRRAVEKDLPVRDPLSRPSRIPGLDRPPARASVDWTSLGLRAAGADERAIFDFQGGEGAGQARLNAYLFEADALRSYKDTRNRLLHADDSSKLSPWLALGCLSPREVYAAVRRYELERVRNESTYWLVFELLWRDYFQLLAAREGPRLFRLSGIGGRRRDWSRNEDAFAAWTEGRTGFPFVDAFMRELAATGFMSNRGRQNVASFLAKGLGIDWRWGATWFERELIDYDPASNWGNWQYVSGVGTDPRDRLFNVIKQSRDYDPDGDFIRRWVPELSSLDGEGIHDPPPSARGVYPPPLIDPPWESPRRRKRR